MADMLTFAIFAWGIP